MLPNSAAVSLIQNYLRNQQGVIEVAKPVSEEQLLVTVGERVQAMVTDQLPSGRFAVLVKDQLLDLNLPRNTQPGEKLDLTVLSSGPKLSFSLSSSPAPQPAQSSLPQTKMEVAFSQAAKMLGELLVRSEGQPKLANVQQAQPLFEGRPVPAQLAGQLATRLAESGLFYESHQAGWVNGERSLQALLREPQAQSTTNPALTTKLQGPSSELMKTMPGGMLAGGEIPADAETTVQRSVADLSLSTVQSHRPEQAVRHLVQQQLELLENHPLVWQGQAWPGQPLRWKLELENERNHDMAGNDASRVWQTQLDLDLPHLGAVEIMASLRGGQFSLHFKAQDSMTVETLKNKQSLLVERFDAAGLSLISSSVMQHDQETNA